MEKNKLIFYSIIAIVLSITLVIISLTFYKVIISDTKGPVHWHADIEIWNCGEKINLKDPESLLNRIGTPLLHEHNDDRIHVEGIIESLNDITLQNFFRVIGGDLTETSIKIPLNKKFLEINNDQLCNQKKAKLQVFIYNKEYTQNKLNDFKNYILSPHTDVPPGNCIIIEFDEEKEKTEKICESYK